MIFSQTETDRIVFELKAHGSVMDMAKLAQNEHVKNLSSFPRLSDKKVICGDDFALKVRTPTPKSVDSVFVCTNENGKLPTMFFVEFKIDQEKIDAKLVEDLYGKEMSSRGLFTCGLSHKSYVVLNSDKKYEQNKNKLGKFLLSKPILKSMSIVNMTDVHNFF